MIDCVIRFCAETQNKTNPKTKFLPSFSKKTKETITHPKKKFIPVQRTK